MLTFYCDAAKTRKKCFRHYRLDQINFIFALVISFLFVTRKRQTVYQTHIHSNFLVEKNSILCDRFSVCIGNFDQFVQTMYSLSYSEIHTI